MGSCTEVITPFIPFPNPFISLNTKFNSFPLPGAPFFFSSKYRFYSLSCSTYSFHYKSSMELPLIYTHKSPYHSVSSTSGINPETLHLSLRQTLWTRAKGSHFPHQNITRRMFRQHTKILLKLPEGAPNSSNNS